MKKGKPRNIHFAVLATDVVCFRVIDNKLSVLIAKAPAHSPFAGEWVLTGGMIRPEETAEDAVSRLLLDKAGIKNIYTEQVYTFSAVDRDPRGRVVSIAYMALTYIDPRDISKASLETKWCPVLNVPKLGYDHNAILENALAKLRSNIHNTNCILHLMPHEFTLSELQKAYETVMGQGIDKRNFRKKILVSNVLKNTKKTRKEGVMRPAILYTFKSPKSQPVENI